ncbi:MAG: carboxylating nicotinate-nucleotide diphosphorylase [Deltaproteobacteria bacterium]|jgi:nicotinate-nucleotide pyrophosphorylase (carboxylating)|nr:carboxylating nicotinate-nucleotide diphosphorylase [Deltaproteobacteria bacterium]
MAFDLNLKNLVELALKEDLGWGDLTTWLTLEPDSLGRAEIRTRQALVLSGLEPARLAFELVDKNLEVELFQADGDNLAPGAVVLRLEGLAQSILMAERVALNFLGRLSGVATLTQRYVKASQELGLFGAKILDTRKTTPGLRALEKAAVRHGGGHNHRFSLGDGILIKDNHIMAVGSIEKALKLAKNKARHNLKIEIEVDSLEQLREALEHGAEAVLLDNMDIPTLRKAVEIVKEFFKGRSRGLLLEASGGVNLKSVGKIAATGVDFISVGALTHSAPSVDLGLDWLDS